MAIYDNLNIDSGKSCLISNINGFINAMINAAKSGVYHSGNIPIIAGSVTYNPSYETGASYTGTTNPQAIIASDLDSLTSVSGGVTTQNAGDVMTASKILSALRTIITQVSKVHNFSATWNHQSGSGSYLVGSASGKAIFKDGLGNGTIGSTAGSTNSMSVTRTVPATFYATTTTAYDGYLAAGQSINANNMKNLMQTLYNQWNSNIANAFSYSIWTCHYNCHNNCYDNRSRR